MFMKMLIKELFSAFRVITPYLTLNTPWQRAFRWYASMTIAFCLRLSESLNPMFYNIASRYDSNNIAKQVLHMTRQVCLFRRNYN